MLLLLVGPVAERGRHLYHPSLPLPRREYVISKLYFFFILLICGAFLWATPHVYSLISFFFFFSSWQSKHKEDTSITYPILLDEPELKVHSFPLHAFSLPRVALCFLFLLHIYLFLLPALTSAFFLSLPFFFRLISSPLLYIALQVRKFLLLWVCPWKASLMGQISWLRP